MFLLVGRVDVLIIELFPAYALKLFATAIVGPLAYLVKLHSPAVHFVMATDFCFCALGLGLGDCLRRLWHYEPIDESAYLRFHPLRTGFMVATALILCYVVWRRPLFANSLPPTERLASSAAGASL